MEINSMIKKNLFSKFLQIFVSSFFKLWNFPCMDGAIWQKSRVIELALIMQVTCIKCFCRPAKRIPVNPIPSMIQFRL